MRQLANPNRTILKRPPGCNTWPMPLNQSSATTWGCSVAQAALLTFCNCFFLFHSQNKLTRTVAFCQSISHYTVAVTIKNVPGQGSWQRSLSVRLPAEVLTMYVTYGKLMIIWRFWNAYGFLLTNFHMTGQFCFRHLYLPASAVGWAGTILAFTIKACGRRVHTNAGLHRLV
jgi:hypothetical protein